jgi:hypothetical protein
MMVAARMHNTINFSGTKLRLICSRMACTATCCWWALSWQPSC